MDKYISDTAEAAAEFHLIVGRKKIMGKSVAFVLPGDFEGVSQSDTNYEVRNMSHDINDI
jgi:hypothetical protein